MFYAIYMATRPRGFALVLVPVYFIKHSVSCYIYYIHYCLVLIFHALDILAAFIVDDSLQVLPLSMLLVSVREWTPSYLTTCNVLEMKTDSLIVLPTMSDSTTAYTRRMPVLGVCQSHVSD